MGNYEQYLLDFDPSRQARPNEEILNRALNDEPALMRNHLAIAKLLDKWRIGRDEDLQNPSPGDQRDPEYHRGYIQALRDIAAHLRQAEMLPDGIFVRRERERVGRSG